MCIRDRTYYKPGEAVWFSAFVRNEDDLKASDYSDIIHVELISPRGNVDKQYRLIAENGVAKGDFDLTGYLGGIYKIRAFTEYQKNDSSILKAEKEITLQTAVLDVYKRQVLARLLQFANGGNMLRNMLRSKQIAIEFFQKYTCTVPMNKVYRFSAIGYSILRILKTMRMNQA